MHDTFDVDLHKEHVDCTSISSLLFDHWVVAGINGCPPPTYSAGSTLYNSETDALSNHVDHHHSEVPK